MDPMLIGILLVGGLVIVGALVYVGLRDDRGRDPLQERLAQYGDRELPQSLEEVEMSLSFKDRVLLPLIERLAGIVARFTPQKQLDVARKKIDQAGLTTDPTQLFLARIVVGVILLIIGIVVFFVLRIGGLNPLMSLLATVGLGLIGFYLPMYSVNKRIKRRQDSVIKALPDALDLLVICVEAGLGFDMAMGKVYDKWENELALAFGRVLREIQLGKSRRDALRDMAERLDVPDVNSFIAAIIQADQLGVSMSKILRVQSDQMRVKRRQRAQEKAHQAPVKMMIPMVLLIFPSIWIVLLGPAILKVVELGQSGIL
ncbi:MAG TPA: type II secretion system F family protein [Aggregatilineales bacterium]|nr:type II secretion system F family protein [Aggregatilineales bacterium]